MGYTVHLFALDADDFAAKLKDQSEELLTRTRTRLEQDDQLEFGDLEYGLGLASQVCRGEIHDKCSEDHFWALCWLADTELERIPLGVLISVKRFSYIEAVGLWPLLAKWKPPFPVPRGDSIPPGVGFLPQGEITLSALPFLDAIPDDAPDVAYARQQFIEVLESLAEDKLDLLAIVL